MFERLIRHVRGNVVGYVALFFSLTVPASAFIITGDLIADDTVTGRDVKESTLVTPRILESSAGVGVASVSCPPGWTATGGGGRAFGPGGEARAISDSSPGLNQAQLPNNWFVEAVDPNATVHALVVCSK